METVSRFLVILTFIALVIGQEQYTINPNSVPLSTRQYWCQSQTTQCPLICLQVGNQVLESRENQCFASSLTYTCVCNNGITPNITKYSLTLPYFICQEWGNQCVNNCGNDATCASDCRQDHPCGAQDPSPPNKTIISASKSAAAAASTKSGGSGAVHTGFADGTSDNTGAAGVVRPPALLGMSGNGGLMVVFSALFFAFAVFL